jgi:5-formyltetrahydrofolate cyclo-ligase
VVAADELRATKAALRREMRVARRAMPAAERAARSAGLVERVRGLALWQTAGLALAFHSFGEEPDVRPLLHGSHPAVLLPRVEGDELVYVAWAPGDPLVPSRFGVPEPLGPPTDPAAAAVALVPGLAFDAAGHRLGYGLGYYDRALRRLGGAVPTVGVCFATELRDAVPVGEDDVAVDIVVTDEG